jgi:hypothetical protein
MARLRDGREKQACPHVNSIEVQCFLLFYSTYTFPWRSQPAYGNTPRAHLSNKCGGDDVGIGLSSHNADLWLCISVCWQCDHRFYIMKLKKSMCWTIIWRARVGDSDTAYCRVVNVEIGCTRRGASRLRLDNDTLTLRALRYNSVSIRLSEKINFRIICRSGTVWTWKYEH